MESPDTTTTAAEAQNTWLHLLEVLGRNRDLLLIQSRMVLTAIAVIYLGAHAALCRPPSAGPRSSSKFGKDKDDKKKTKEEATFTEGFQASDAILFPILAGLTLVGLYYLIQWMDDPKLISKIISGYFSVASLFSLGKMLGDTLHFFLGLVFPNVWRDGNGDLWRFDPLQERQLRREQPTGVTASYGPSSLNDEPGNYGRVRGGEGADSYRDESGHWVPDKDHLMPFPGWFATWNASQGTLHRLWVARQLVKGHWTVKLGLHGVGMGKFEVALCDVLGMMAATGVALAYQYTGATVLSNVMGLGMCYGAFQLMSPTSFPIGTMVLAGLFVYDIVMVFYTPYMITVATKVDAPIKLTFGEPAKGSMLGLGDIVLPGIFMCLCLRFDLWRHYQAKAKESKREMSIVYKKEEGSEAKGDSVATTKTHQETFTTKAEYIDPQGRWGDMFWTAGIRKDKGGATLGLAAARFPKTYFTTSVVGYAVGMALTISMLLVFNHGQPALLYLVPCVTGAAWLTGAARGELGQMWKYTEDGSLDVKDVVATVDGEGNAVQDGGPDAQQKQDGDKQQQLERRKTGSGEDEDARSKGQQAGTKPTGDGHDVFMFVVRAPGADDLDDFDV